MEDEKNKKQIINLQGQLVVKIIQKLFPNSQWAKNFGNDNINAKLFFIVLIPAVIIALIFIALINFGYIQ
jgi:hypothetical protein